MSNNGNDNEEPTGDRGGVDITQLRAEMMEEMEHLYQKYKQEKDQLKTQTEEAMDLLVSSELANAEHQEAYLVQRNEIRKIEKNKLLLNFKSAAAREA